jgi:class 3 adenylate cyclase
MTATRRLAAILAADVARYSRLIGADEEGTLNRLRSIRTELIDLKIAEHRGRVVITIGDGFPVEFSSVVDARVCATQWQRGWPNLMPMCHRSAESGSVSEFTRAISSCRTVVSQPALVGCLVALYCAKDE